MSVAGRRSALALAAVGLAAVIVLAAVPGASAQGPGKDFKVTRDRGKARVIGTLTPLQTETILVKGMPPGSKFGVVMLPPAGVPQCQHSYACNPVFPKPLPGTGRFRISGKGRAVATFQMPNAYTRAPVVAPDSFIFEPFKNGEVLQIGILSIKFRGPNHPIEGLAVTRGVVEVPPAG